MTNFLRPIFAVTMVTLLAASLSVPSDAAPRAVRHAATTVYDGLWTVSIMTLYGNCNSSYRYPLRIASGRVVKADDDQSYQLYGAVGRSGAITVTVSGGGQTASGSGRLTRNFGSGRWRTSTGECSGRWTAQRRS